MLMVPSGWRLEASLEHHGGSRRRKRGREMLTKDQAQDRLFRDIPIMTPFASNRPLPVPFNSRVTNGYPLVNLDPS